MRKAKSFSHIGTSAINVLARLAARNEVKQQLRDQAIRPSSVKRAASPLHRDEDLPQDTP
jgi:hypothetical protein